MAVTIRENETPPAAYPPVPEGLSDAAKAMDHGAIWQRIESYVAHRWTPREVVWMVEGSGPWEAPLAPAALQTVEVWDNGQWIEATPGASPWGGYDLPCDGPYRITATVGGGDLPPAVSEAFRRLAEYMSDDSDRAGVSSYSVNMGGAIQESYSRNAAHMARALQNSGAADLLRPYRRA